MPKQTALRARIVQAIANVGLTAADKSTQDKFVNLVRTPFETTTQRKAAYTEHPPMNVIENVAILRISLQVSNAKIAEMIAFTGQKRAKLIERQRKEQQFLADAYARANQSFDQLHIQLKSEAPFKELNLKEAFTHNKNIHQRPKYSAPLHILREIEAIKWSAEHENGDPNALCKMAEEYMAAGAFDIAQDLIDEVLESDPHHFGGWFQKARLQLARSKKSSRDAVGYQHQSDFSDTASVAERHYEELAMDEAGKSIDLEQQAFETCLTAYSLLPDWRAYEKSAITWSRDYGTLRELRDAIEGFLVSTASKLADPRCTGGPIHSRVKAKIGDHVMFASKFAPPRDHEAERKLAAEPLFSEAKDSALLTALYNQKHRPFNSRRRSTWLQLDGLNLIRVLEDQETYKKEVRDFIENLKRDIAEHACRFFGPFSDPDSLSGWRNLLHDHLDGVLSRSEQIDLIDILHEAWVCDIRERKKQAQESVFNDDIANCYQAENHVAAFERAIEGEQRGIYKRTDAYEALVLLRCAQHVCADNSAPKEAREHAQAIVNNEALRQFAEDYYEDNKYENGDPWQDNVFPEHLWNT